LHLLATAGVSVFVRMIHWHRRYVTLRRTQLQLRHHRSASVTLELTTQSTLLQPLIFTT